MNIAEQESGVEGTPDNQESQETELQQEEQQQQEQGEYEEISIAGAEAQAADPAEQENPVIRQVREAHREEARKRKAAERELEQYRAKAQASDELAPKVGEKPTLDQFDFDTDRYEEELVKWHESKSALAAYERKQRSTQEAQQQEHQKVVDTYKANAAALPVDQAKFKAAEDEVVSTFDVMQQNILLRAKSPERLVYAIGNNPAKLEELAKIKDPIALAYELGRVENGLTVTKQKKSAPAPDRPLTSGSTSSVDSTMERLEAEAEKTGDRSKIAAYRRQLKQAQT